MPNNEVMVWIRELAGWLMWYEYVQEELSTIDMECPSEIKDFPDRFKQWLKSQRSKDAVKNNPYKSR